MEGRRYRELFAGQPAGAEYVNGPFDLATGAGQHRLGRGVAVGNHQVELFLGQHLFDGCQRG